MKVRISCDQEGVLEYRCAICGSDMGYVYDGECVHHSNDYSPCPNDGKKCVPPELVVEAEEIQQ